MKINLDGDEYLLSDFSPQGQTIWNQLYYTDQMIKQFEAQKALLNRARNAYIEDLKTEAIELKSGVNLAALFSDE